MKIENKYPQCYQCLYNNCNNKLVCESCKNEDSEYNLEPPTNWKYEDQEGEWK